MKNQQAYWNVNKQVYWKVDKRRAPGEIIFSGSSYIISTSMKNRKHFWFYYAKGRFHIQSGGTWSGFQNIVVFAWSSFPFHQIILFGLFSSSAKPHVATQSELFLPLASSVYAQSFTCALILSSCLYGIATSVFNKSRSLKSSTFIRLLY